MRRRNGYRGFSSPLDSYPNHSEIHNLGRRELSLSDSGLHRSLIRWEQIGMAIPEKRKIGRKPLSHDEVEKIQFIHSFTGSVVATARETGHDPKTIRRCLEKYREDYQNPY